MGLPNRVESRISVNGRSRGKTRATQSLPWRTIATPPSVRIGPKSTSLPFVFRFASETARRSGPAPGSGRERQRPAAVADVKRPQQVAARAVDRPLQRGAAGGRGVQADRPGVVAVGQARRDRDLVRAVGDRRPRPPSADRRGRGVVLLEQDLRVRAADLVEVDEDMIILPGASRTVQRYVTANVRGPVWRNDSTVGRIRWTPEKFQSTADRALAKNESAVSAESVTIPLRSVVPAVTPAPRADQPYWGSETPSTDQRLGRLVGRDRQAAVVPDADAVPGLGAGIARPNDGRRVDPSAVLLVVDPGRDRRPVPRHDRPDEVRFEPGERDRRPDVPAQKPGVAERDLLHPVLVEHRRRPATARSAPSTGPTTARSSPCRG